MKTIKYIIQISSIVFICVCVNIDILFSQEEHTSSTIKEKSIKEDKLVIEPWMLDQNEWIKGLQDMSLQNILIEDTDEEILIEEWMLLPLKPKNNTSNSEEPEPELEQWMYDDGYWISLYKWICNKEPLICIYLNEL